MNTLVELLLHSAHTWPKRTALKTVGGDEVTYEQLAGKAARWSRFLSSAGIARGDHVALLTRNSSEAVAAYFGILSAGAVAVPINHSSEAEIVRDVVEDSEAKALVQEPMLGRRAGDLGDIQRLNLPEIADFQDTATNSADSHADVTADDLASIVYTSGSTSKPMGVMLSHQNLTSNGLSIAEYMKLRENESVLCVLPLYYIYGFSLVLSHMAVGGCVVFENRFLYPQTVVDSLAATNATGFAGVSSHYHLLMRDTDFLTRDFPALRYFQHAGDKMPTTTTGKIVEAFPNKELYLMYGQTEAAPRLSYLHPSKTATKPASVGQAIPGVDLKVIREDGSDCDAEEDGQIVAAGPNIMRGYWKHPQKTAEKLRDGWLHTGDLGHVDTDGDIFISGRASQFLKVGGRRISPTEIEGVCLEHPSVDEAAVIGVDDEVLGQRTKLFVVPNETDSDELMEFLKKRLPTYKLPSEIETLAQLPKKANGKVDKNQLS